MMSSAFRLTSLVAAVIAIRALIAWLVPIDLAGDESYYWEWGRHVDVGFYSKPPLIGWLMAGLGILGVDTELGIRLTAVMFGSLTLVFLVLLARDIFGDGVAERVALMTALVPIALPANLLLTIDAPLSSCWAGALLAAWKISTAAKPGLGRWHLLLLGTLALGVLTKQIMLAFPALWIGWLALSPARRQVLIRPATWVVLLGSLLALLPPILWNANEGWVTFEHTASHFKSSEWDPLRAAGWLLSFAGSQAFLWGPVLSFAAIRLLVSSKRGNLTEEKGFLLTFSLPLALVLVLALRQNVLPNWPAVFWLGLLVVTAQAIEPRTWRWVLRSNGLLSLGLLLLVMLAPLTPGSRSPLHRVLGWQEYATAVARVDQAQWPQREQIDQTRALIVFGHRYYASALAFYHPERPFVRVYQTDAVIRTQYGIWDRRDPVTQAQALIVIPGAAATFPTELARRWPCARPLGTVSSRITSGAVRVVSLWRATKICN